MEILLGDIWKIARTDDVIVVPTNIGWRKDGSNVMGAGLAKQLKRKWPEIEKQYGTMCQHYKDETPVIVYQAPDAMKATAVALFPVKPLRADKPYLSWQNKAELWLIEKSALELQTWITSAMPDKGRVLLPLCGCGNGGLDPATVEPRLHNIITSPQCYLVKMVGDLKEL